MNTLDWQCEACRAVQELSGFTSQNPPTCQACSAGNSMVILWSVPHISAWEKPWKYWDKDGNDKEFKSIAEVRSYEKECERRAANGEGNIEVAAQFSMDRSNRLDPLWKRPRFKPNPFTRSGQRMVFRRGADVARDHRHEEGE